MFTFPEKSNGQTDTKILLEAMAKDKVHLARFILDALDGKIIDSKTEGAAQTPLISSVLLPDCQTRCKFMELLIQRGASVNCQDERGRTALSYACEKGFLDAVKILVRNNADPEIIDPWGNTALMYAAVAGHSPVVEFLVRAFKRLGLQIDRQNKVGNSAVEVAKYLGHTDCIFALTSNAKKVHEYDVGVLTDSSDCTVNEKKLERKLDPLVRRHEITQTGPMSDGSAALDGTWLSRTTGRRRNSLITKARLQSMDSIEEFDRENESSPSSPQDLFFSGVLTPKPPPRANSGQTSVCNSSKTGEKWASIDGHLPPLNRGCEHQMTVLYSPRPGKNTSTCCAQSASASSPLGILLTPITGKKVEKDESEKEKLKPLDFSVRRFDESYYEKRCSLPTSIFSPVPPDRSLMPLRKTKTIRRHPSPTVNTETTAPAVTSTTFSTLSNRLLRRFTFPEFKKSGKEDQQEVACGGEPSVSARGIPHSETFPLSKRHPQVGSKSSIDSISAVKCEFDFHFRALK